MRTNIEIDDKLMSRALEVSGLPTKRAVVEEALRLLVRKAAGEQLIALAGKVDFFDGHDPEEGEDEVIEWSPLQTPQSG